MNDPVRNARVIDRPRPYARRGKPSDNARGLPPDQRNEKFQRAQGQALAVHAQLMVT